MGGDAIWSEYDEAGLEGLRSEESLSDSDSFPLLDYNMFFNKCLWPEVPLQRAQGAL